MLLYELLTLKRPFEEIEAPIINIFEEIEKGGLPHIQQCDLTSPYSSLITLHRSCVQLQAELRPSLESILHTLRTLFRQYSLRQSTSTPSLPLTHSSSSLPVGNNNS
jgi:hypothetical protein